MEKAQEDLPPELADIAAAAAELEPVAPGTESTEVSQEQSVDYLTDAKGVTDIAATALGALYPSTEKVLTPETRDKFAQALAPVMEKYGMNLGAVFGRWGAEINLAFVVAGFAIPLAQAVRADRQASNEQSGQQQKPQPIEKAGLQPVIDRTDPSSLHNRV